MPLRSEDGRLAEMEPAIRDRERAAGLLAARLGAARRLGMTAFAERAREDLARACGDSRTGQAPLPPVRTAEGTSPWSVFRREGEYWSIAFAGEEFRLKDVKGLHYLEQLLHHPGREFHVLDLAAAGHAAGGARAGPAREDDLHEARPSGTGPVLGEQAKAAYRARLRELEQELAEATRWADPVRAAKARQERQFLADELSAAVGLGGRDLTAGISFSRQGTTVPCPVTPPG